MNRRFIAWCVCCLGALVVLPIAAEEDATSFAAVLAANPPREDMVCSYTSEVTEVTNSERPGETRTVRFTADEDSTAEAPSGSFELLAVNGEPPSAEALAEFETEAEERPRRAESVVFDLPEDEFSGDVSAMRFVEEDANTVSFAFVPDIGGNGGGEGSGEDEGDKEDEMARNVRGLVVFGKPDLRPQRMSLTLDEPFSPAPTVKISEFRQEMVFAVEPVTNAAVLVEMNMVMRGRALVFKKMENETHAVFSDFNCREAAQSKASESSADVTAPAS